jgi:RNA polymerase sigma factor (TIGR02999 family)
MAPHLEQSGNGRQELQYARIFPRRDEAMTAPTPEITDLLRRWTDGDRDALNELTPLVYQQLRHVAHHHMVKEQAGHPLQTTALVHEAYLRLASAGTMHLRDRRHFFAVAARMMRRVLVDAARERAARKRGGGATHVGQGQGTALDLDTLPALSPNRAADLCAVDDALEALARLDDRRAQVVELRFFGGLSVEETADVLEVSPQTVMRDWRLARAWLTRELRPS